MSGTIPLLDDEPDVARLARAFVAGIGAAIQQMEAARPGLIRADQEQWLHSDPGGMIGFILWRGTSVSASMALMRVWCTSSRGDFHIDILSAALNKSFRKGDLTVAPIRELLKRDREFRASLSVLERWRNKRLAHRDIAAIAAESPDDPKVGQEDFDRVADRSVAIGEALRLAFPEMHLRDLGLFRDTCQQNAQAFWSRLKSPT